MTVNRLRKPLDQIKLYCKTAANFLIFKWRHEIRFFPYTAVETWWDFMILQMPSLLFWQPCFIFEVSLSSTRKKIFPPFCKLLFHFINVPREPEVVKNKFEWKLISPTRSALAQIWSDHHCKLFLSL